MSFAGQYTSVLNVGRDGIADAYKEVVASLYSPQAIFYRGVHGIPDEDLPMGVLCMDDGRRRRQRRRDARSIPTDPRPDVCWSSGAWGLGVGTVSGSVSPDTWVVAETGARRDPREPAGLEGRPGRARPPRAASPPTAVPQDQRDRFCLSDDQVRDPWRTWSCRRRRTTVCPQEIEWALDREGRFVLLQARPLRRRARARSRLARREIDGHRLLLTGTGASRGCGSGPVYRFTGRRQSRRRFRPAPCSWPGIRRPSSSR